jgi:hypothetical protein
MTTSYQKHFLSDHEEEWKQVCEEQGLKEHVPGSKKDVLAREKFTEEGFIDQLICWICADNQVCSYFTFSFL